MNRKLLSTVLSFMLVLTLLACATQPAMAQAPSPKPVLAEAPPPPGDDGAPPAAASSPAIPDEEQKAEPEKEDPAVEASTPAEVAAPAVDFSQWTPPPVLDTGAVAPAAAAAFISDEQMLDSGGVLRAQGETLAALFVAGAIACPAGKVPLIYNGTSDTGCTPYYSLPGNPIQQAHNHALTKTGWWIWVSPSYPNAGALTILTKSVVVKGDALGTSVTGTIAMNYPSITLRELVVANGRITSTGQSGTLRLQGVSVTGTFLNTYGIEISGHRGSIALANVSATIATGRGAYLDATGGTGTVTVLNSAFNNNPNGDGLTILAKNAVKVENVSVAGNGKATSSGDGLQINYRTRLTLKNIYAYDNYDRGIQAVDTSTTTTGGPVTLTNITASANDFWEGIYLWNPGPVSGSNLILNNNAFDDGIKIQNGRGSVALSGVTAVGNAFKGIRILNNAGAISINTSRVGGNGTGGVLITSKGSVSVKNSLIYNSGGTDNGVNINNSLGTLPASVTLTNLNVAQNDYYGIWVNSKGTLTLSGIASNANGRAGAWLVTSGGGVTVSSSYGANTFNDNGASAFCTNTPDVTCSGLYIDAKNAVSVSGASADNNRYHGMEILNASSVRVADSTIENNSNAYGLYVAGKGSVTLDRVTAKYSLWGIFLDNNAGAGAPSISLSRVVADHNTWGLIAYSRGSLIANQVRANNNTWGLIADSQGTMTLNHLNTNKNLWGALISSRGSMTLNHASSSYNTVFGMSIDNTAGVGGVTLTNSLGSDLISQNASVNLTIYTRGPVSIRGLNASGSPNGYGALIDNSTSPSSAGVSISSSDFNGNGDGFGDFGLRVLSKGSITLNTVNASNNKGAGAELQNQTATLTGKTVSVSKGLFNNNGSTGVLIGSKSSVTLNNVIVSGNASWGAAIDNYQFGAGTGNVTISSSLGRNLFNNNLYTGVFIETAGSVSVSNAEANGAGNFSSGFYIRSHGTAKTATFTCVSATNNTHYGIEIDVLAGSIALTLKGVWLGVNTPGNLEYPDTPKIYLMTCP